MLLIRSALPHFSLTLITIFGPQRKTGDPVIHIRHVDDWLERQARGAAGFYIPSHMGGE